jgi:hypothetical protein
MQETTILQIKSRQTYVNNNNKYVGPELYEIGGKLALGVELETLCVG